MGKKYLIDTNAVIEYLENRLPNAASVVLDNTDIQISVISRMGLLGKERRRMCGYSERSACLYYCLPASIL